MLILAPPAVVDLVALDHRELDAFNVDQRRLWADRFVLLQSA